MVSGLAINDPAAYNGKQDFVLPEGKHMFGLGVQELIIIFLIIMVLFGAKKLPEMGKGLGRGIREFKRASEQTLEDDNEEPSKVESKQQE
jgi:sec-independent protein translocase protein TatA